MKKWIKIALFLLPLLLFIGIVNWYVDSYALLRVTYDDIAAQMAAGKNVEGLEESDYIDRNLVAARLSSQEAAPTTTRASCGCTSRLISLLRAKRSNFRAFTFT